MEEYAVVVEFVVAFAFVVVINVAFGVGENGPESFHDDLKKDLVKVESFLNVRAFHEQIVAMQASDDARAAERKSQVGSGDRSERIRTYNFPQGRVTDHRIGLTLYKIDSIVNGGLDDLIEPLIANDRAEKLRGED